ncbi:hypothetical protein ACJMK2_012978 [Sinanodonta woodiana]|uniref:DNA 5'-3' helicase n=1 Tax=Sinanodonta woodiana TaxID=1069815 RepID=A0ABD3V9X7_SINWO
MADTEDKMFTIQGVKVMFPCKPYPSQFSMMDRVIKGLERRQNCLLESPTGSGKSLALLCSALAWQFAENEKVVREQLEDLDKKDGCCKCNKNGITQTTNDSKNVEKTLEQDKSLTENAPKIPGTGLDADDDDDFRPLSTIRSLVNLGTKVLKRKFQSIFYETSPPEASLGCHGDSDMSEIKSSTCQCSCKDSGSSGKKRKVPKIFYGTRTHKQITQIAKELRKTAYHGVRMVILASREHTCINPDVIRMKSKSDGCRERTDIRGPGCKFKDKTQRVLLNQTQLQEAGLNTAWDLEDLLKIGRAHKACPYFVSRNVVGQADIILCPYNYLIDPTIRKSMEINLKDNIMILDEAHNIEDAAREAASESIFSEDLAKAIQNLNELVENHISFPEHLELKNMCERLHHFLNENSSHLERKEYDQAYKCWSGFDIVARLSSIQLGPKDFPRYQKLYDKLLSEEQEDTLIRNHINQVVKRSSSTSQLLERLFKVLDYMYRDDMKYVDDYRVAIQKSMIYSTSRETDSTWLNSKQKQGGRKTSPSWECSINFWCMNPAVAFSDFSVTRSIVLSSGTLSPISSFQSELGVSFPVQLEANHVIESDRVWVGAIGQGPTGRSLQAVYKTMESFDFQDELGNLIHKVCMNVPHGVLCFVPSYRALEKFTERWRNTGLWRKLLQRKRVVVEPRASEKVEFEELMKYFYDSIHGDAADSDEDVDNSEVDGALFFAVCRGKVSEGLDFADNNARAVITVGIPYPSIKDNQVKLKKEYNDKHKASRGLLSGNEWYEIQAYRALNQALGRCIRHRKDWGALIIVDERFVNNREKYCKGLSKWVRNKVQSYHKFESAMESLSEFTAKFAKETPICADTSFIPSTPSTPKYSVYQNKNNSFTSPSLASPILKSEGIKFLPQSPVTPPAVRFEIKNRADKPLLTKGDKPLLLSPPSQEMIHEQLKAVINSPSMPKDKPYYVLINEGTPYEQKFLIKPPKKMTSLGTGLASAVSNGQSPGQALISAPANVPPVQVLNSSLTQNTSVPVAGEQHAGLPSGSVINNTFSTPKKETDNAGKTSIGINQPLAGQQTLAALLAKNPETQYLLVNHFGQQIASFPQASAAFTLTSLLAHQKTWASALVKSKPFQEATSKPQLVFAGEQPVLLTTQGSNPARTNGNDAPILLQFQVPKNTTEVAGCEASTSYPKPASLLMMTNLPQKPTSCTIANSDSIQKMGMNKAQSNQANPGDKSREKSAKRKSSGFDPYVKENKFLQFCNLVKKEPEDCSEPTLNLTMQESLKAEPAGRSVTPLLHEGIEKDIKMEISYNDETSTEVKGAIENRIMKRPLFRRSAFNNRRVVMKKPNTSYVDTSSNCGISEMNIDGSVTKKIEKTNETENCVSDIEVKTECGNLYEIEAKYRKETIEIPESRKGDNSKTTDSILEIGNSMDPNNSDDEAFDSVLNTRRRRGKRAQSLVKHKAKRSKGVQYAEENGSKENETKENEVHQLSCSSCGSSFIAVSAVEKTRDVPKFWLDGCGLEVIQIKNLDLLSSFEVAVADIHTSVTLNCLWCADVQCGVQFLQCRTCKKTIKGGNPAGIIGARILFTAEGCKDFSQGQVKIIGVEVDMVAVLSSNNSIGLKRQPGTLTSYLYALLCKAEFNTSLK